MKKKRLLLGNSSKNTFIDYPSEPMQTRQRKKAKTSGVPNVIDPYGEENYFMVQNSDSDDESSYTIERSKTAKRKSRSS